MTPLSDADLLNARDLGAATYLSAYTHLLARLLGVDDSDDQAINLMAQALVEPVNLATEAAFRALMNDHRGSQAKMQELQSLLAVLP